MVKIIIIINEKELDIKKAIAKGWNKRFNEELMHKDIGGISNKEDILGAIPYLDTNKIDIEVQKFKKEKK
jgi:hypothetical protein